MQQSLTLYSRLAYSHGMTEKSISPLRRLRKQSGLTQDQLAALAGTEQAQISRLEKRERELDADWAIRLAPHLGIDWLALVKLHNDGTETATALPSVANIPTRQITKIKGRTPPLSKEAEAFHNDRGLMMPLHSSVQAGAEGAEILPDIIDWTPTPHKLVHVDGAFGIVVVGDSMQPKYDDGNIVYVHPHKALKRGKPCVIELSNGMGLVKIYEGKNDDGWQFSQYNPKMSINKTIAEVTRVMRVVGSMEEE